MNELRFDDRVAVVTGAGRGIGRGYAELLAARGARVVVNDLGGAIDGSGADTGPAGEVVAAIVAAGGTAVADTSDVSTPAGAEALLGTAVERFGRIDVLVNNAGIVRWAGLPEADLDNIERHLAVHVAGSFNTARAAWPTMVDQGYGRIVHTTSAGVFGLPTNLGYATAKGGVVGMTRSMAVAGRKLGIRVNAIAPAAMTRMAGPTRDDDPMTTLMAPALVAPMVAYLAHEDCPVTGEIYAAGSGRFSRIVLASTPGWLAPGAADGAGASVEDVAAHWAEINDEAGATVPRGLMDWSATFNAHLRPDAT